MGHLRRKTLDPNLCLSVTALSLFLLTQPTKTPIVSLRMRMHNGLSPFWPCHFDPAEVASTPRLLEQRSWAPPKTTNLVGRLQRCLWPWPRVFEETPGGDFCGGSGSERPHCFDADCFRPKDRLKERPRSCLLPHTPLHNKFTPKPLRSSRVCYVSFGQGCVECCRTSNVPVAGP